MRTRLVRSLSIALGCSFVASAAGPPQDLAAAAKRSEELGEIAVVASLGRVTTARVESDGALYLERAGKSSTLVARPSDGKVISWPVGASEGRTAALAWVESNESASRIMAALVTDDRAANPVLVSGAVSRYSRFPSIAADGQGAIWIAWVDGSMETDNIVVSHGDGTRFAAPERVSQPDATEDLVPQIGIDADAHPVVVWAGFDGRDDEILWSRSENGHWTEEARVAPDNSVPDVTPTLARDMQGNLFVAWSGLDGGSYQIIGCAMGKSGRWSAPVRLSSGEGAATLPRALPSDRGAVVLWNQYDGRGSVIGARALDASGAASDVASKERVAIPLSFKPNGTMADGTLEVVTPGQRLIP